MYYINYKCPYTGQIETIEDRIPLNEARVLIKEYKLVSSGYYLSSRATKQHYAELKQINN